MTTFTEKTTVSEINEFDLALAQSLVARAWPMASPKRDERAITRPTAPQRSNVASAEIRHLSALIWQLEELRNAEKSDDYGILRPSDSAYDRARDLLIDAAIFAARKGRQIPHGCVSTDSEGGIRVEWVRSASSVHLAVPATSRRSPYIYHEVGDSYATEPASPESLASWLRAIAD
jgi:hypothetical protein